MDLSDGFVLMGSITFPHCGHLTFLAIAFIGFNSSDAKLKYQNEEGVTEINRNY
jgi:hypothetical protein